MNITDETLRAAILAVADERPDYVYEAPEHLLGVPGGPSCFYVHDDAPGCLIGAAMHRLGVPLDTLRRHEMAPAYDVISALAPGVSGRMLTEADGVQSQQDYGSPWGEAVANLRSVGD